MHKTDYLRIHENVYKRQRNSGNQGWSNESAVMTMCDIVQDGLEKYKVDTHNLLELGCGDASVSIALASHGFDIYGIDIVPTAISWAREKASKRDITAEFTVGSVTNLPYEDDFFDLVLDADCSHCIIGSDRAAFFSHAFRVLRPGGLFVLVALCGNPPDNLIKYFDIGTRCLVKNGIAGRYYGLAENILIEAESSGFQILDWRIVRNDFQDQEMILYCTKE